MSEPRVTFEWIIETLKHQFPKTPVHTATWQGVDISKKPEMAMHEIQFQSIRKDIHTEDLSYWRTDIQPNTPWADDHFLERVCGEPLNPGETWNQWPYAHSANSFRDENGQFNHNYMERYWPKYAGYDMIAGHIPEINKEAKDALMKYGIRGKLGDIDDVIDLLHKDPLTRQAYIPVFFPEDTGTANPGRKPCTLGYHLMLRDNKLHIVYYIRSCDFIRHFRDDIYLTVRLQLWILDKLRELDKNWNQVKSGTFIMHISSLHMFRNDYLTLDLSK